MIELTEEQRNAIRDGLPVRLSEDGNQYVLLRADIYERLAESEYDDSPWTAEEMDQLRADSLTALDRYGKDSCVLLFHDRFLFTGDHLDWDRDERRLAASEDYCWYTWPQQAESMKRLADYHFEWVLPGHGQKVCLPAGEMREQILRLAKTMGE